MLLLLRLPWQGHQQLCRRSINSYSCCNSRSSFLRLLEVLLWWGRPSSAARVNKERIQTPRPKSVPLCKGEYSPPVSAQTNKRREQEKNLFEIRSIEI